MGLLSKLERGSEIYCENTALRALITAIPHIGGSIDIIFSSRASKLIEERLLYLLARLRVELKSLKDEIIDKDFIESEEFFDLIMRTIDASAKTRHRVKINSYAKLLTNSILIQDREEFSPEDFLNIILELTPKEIKVARIIYEQQKHNQNELNELAWVKKMGWETLPNQCSFLPEDDLCFILLRLQKSGLIREITGSYVGYMGGVYVITETFRKLMLFFNENL